VGEIVPAVAADGAANGFDAVQAKLAALERAAAQLNEHAERVAQRMRANAKAATTVADLSAAAQVDGRHVAAIAEVAGHFARVAGGALRLSGAAESMHQAAGHLRSAHRAEYGGVHAAVAASRARQAKPGFYRQT
jgi:ABC-type transporter Mla MlaB component